MTSTFISLTEEEFDQQYPLRRNHLNPTATWSLEDGIGCLFETFGEELAYVRQSPPKTIWTLIDGEDGDPYIISGLHFVNRLGYFLSDNAVPSDVTIGVAIPMKREDEL